MAAAPVSLPVSNLLVRIDALRRHAALVRSLLHELERLTPAPPTDTRAYVVADQLIDELTRLGWRILECAATMAPSEAEAPGRVDREPLDRSS